MRDNFVIQIMCLVVIGFLIRKPRHVRTYYRRPLFMVSLTQFFWPLFSPVALTKGPTLVSVNFTRNLNIFQCKFCAKKNDCKQVVVTLCLYLPIVSDIVRSSVCIICSFKVERYPCPPTCSSLIDRLYIRQTYRRSVVIRTSPPYLKAKCKF